MKLLKKLTAVEGKLATAEAATTPKKTRKALKVAGKQIAGAVRLTTKQRGKKITPATADAVLGALNVLPPIVGALNP
jgi:hypothetical protein